MTEPKKLYRNPDDAWLGGVASGIAAYFNLDPLVVRVVAIVLMFVTALLPVALAYLVLWLVIPPRPAVAPPAVLPP